MSENNEARGSRAPKLTVDQTPAATPSKDERAVGSDGAPTDGVADELHEAVGFLKGAGVAAWRYAVKHPHTALGAVIGFIVAVLILTVGLWSTIVIGIFVLIGALIGQIRDGDNGIVNFFGRLFSGKH